jgi:hypothetical protein
MSDDDRNTLEHLDRRSEWEFPPLVKLETRIRNIMTIPADTVNPNADDWGPQPDQSPRKKSGWGPPVESRQCVRAPPPQFDHAYNGQVIERVLPLDEARKACANIGVHADGCAGMRNQDQACIIIIPSDGPDPDLDDYRRNLIAHCNGWRN